MQKYQFPLPASTSSCSTLFFLLVWVAPFFLHRKREREAGTQNLRQLSKSSSGGGSVGGYIQAYEWVAASRGAKWDIIQIYTSPMQMKGDKRRRVWCVFVWVKERARERRQDVTRRKKLDTIKTFLFVTFFSLPLFSFQNVFFPDLSQRHCCCCLLLCLKAAFCTF